MLGRPSDGQIAEADGLGVGSVLHGDRIHLRVVQSIVFDRGMGWLRRVGYRTLNTRNVETTRHLNPSK